MSLPVPNLDDRRFQDLVDEAKRRIPQLCPEWTNHNVSDPGVALIELFAWMTEMSVFRINRFPDVFYTRMLNLLGVDQYPASAARADLTFWTTATIPSVTVPAGTEVRSSDGVGESVVFTTLDDVTIEQPTLIGALTSTGEGQYRDEWEDLSLGLNPVTCFRSEIMTPGDAFYLGFDSSLAGSVVRLSVSASAEGIGVIPDRPPLVWEAWQGEGWAATEVPTLVGESGPADTTGGLNRNGTIVVMVPQQHEPLTLGGVAAHWIRVRLIDPGPGQPIYRTSPRIRSVTAATIGGTVVAEHSQRVDDEVVGESNGFPGQVFTVSRTPVLPRKTTERLVVDYDGISTEWAEVADFVDSTPDDFHYTWDSTTGEIHLGPLIRNPDGSSRQRGHVPPEKAVLRVTSFRTGGGAIGNVGRGKLNSVSSTIPYISGVVNLHGAAGGVDAESVENAKLRGPNSIRAGGRAVTVSDFERLVEEADSRIAQVKCLPPQESGDPIRLLVVPKIEHPPEVLELDQFALPDDMIRRVGEHLDERRILGSRIEVGAPFYQGVSVAVLLAAKPRSPVELVKQRALQRLYGYINPITGGSSGDGWKFDTDLNASEIFQLLAAVEGVERVEDVLFFQYDARNEKRFGPGLERVKLQPDSLFLSSDHQVVVR